MQSDIVQRLLDEHARNGGQGAYAWCARELCGKAAAEISRLTSQLRAAEEREKALREAVMDGRVTECPYNHPVGTRCPNCAGWPFKKGGAANFVTAVRAELERNSHE